jgi:hypothetical protein
MDPMGVANWQISLHSSKIIYRKVDMPREIQISAIISSATQTLLDRHVRATGVKKGHILEEALLHHLRALDALPADVIAPPRLVVSRRSGREMIKRMTAPPKPARQLRALLSGDGD